MEDRLKCLSPEQKAVVTHRTGPLLVVAGAGSGKTRALTYRAAYLVDTGVAPEQILISTFTNRATREFKERLELLLGDNVNRLALGTLHGTGCKILRTYGELAGFDPKFPIYDSRDSFNVAKKVAVQLGIEKEVMTARAIVDGVCRYKEKLINPNRAKYEATSDYDRLLADAYECYQTLMEAESAMDFGDLIKNTVYLLEQFPKVRERLGLEYLLVDEFQDTDHSQFTMVKALMGPARNLTAVGDIDQAIYSFRGADHRIMCDFKTYFPDAVVQSLGKNYRCSNTIVSAAAEVIEKNENRIIHDLCTDNPWGESITFVTVRDEREEAAVVVSGIITAHKSFGIPLGEIAVLYRTNIQSQAMEEELLYARIPYHVVGARFFERKEILDVLCYLRVLDNENDSAAWHDLLTRPKKRISDTALKHMATMMTETGLSLAELVKDPESLPITEKQKTALRAITAQVALVRSLMGNETLPQVVHKILIMAGIKEFYKERESAESSAKGTNALDNLNRLLTIIANGYGGIAIEALPDFLDFASLLSDEQDQAEGVQLMTLHAAKGTEFQAVFLLGVEEDSIPHWRAKNSPDPHSAIEEERRLFYVGMTRAKKRLYLTNARNRKNLQQQQITCSPSRFLKDIPSALMVKWNANDRFAS
jgi:DNA helicase-2/ATP-dependent DNA helicase PcrA